MAFAITPISMVSCVERYRDDAVAVQVRINYAAADGIAIQPNQKVEQRCTIPDKNLFLHSSVLRISSEK